MKNMVLTEEEKNSIREQYQTPPKEATEQIRWDEGNQNALKSYMDMGKPDRKFIIRVEEPFEFETTDSDEYHKLKHILIKTRTKFTDDVHKIER